MRWLALLVLVGRGSPAAMKCATDCDCTASTANQKCVGEWICTQGTCAYACKSVCNAGPFTCASNEKCNGTICSQKTSCP